MTETTRDLVDPDLEARVRARMALVDAPLPLDAFDDLDDETEEDRAQPQSTRRAAAL